MGDLVGQHPVLAEVQDRIVGAAAVVAHGVEHVDGEALEGPVHAGEAQHGIGVAGRLEQQRLLGELADLGAHVLGELDRDLDVAGLVPALAGHVELHGEGHVVAAGAGVEVVAGATGALERLDLAHEDAVHELAGGVGRVGILRLEGRLPPALPSAGVEHDLLDTDALEPRVACEIVDRQHLLHAGPCGDSH